MSLTRLAFLVSLCLFAHAFAQGRQSAADQPYSLFGAEAAILDRGGIYARMVGHKTVLLNRDRTEIVGEAIASPSQDFEAAADLLAGTINVSKTEWHGRWGRQKKYWEMKGKFELLGLADDGEHLVAGARGVYPLPLNYKKNQVMFSFFDRGGLIAEVTLDRLITDFSRIERRGSGYRWGRYLGLNRAGYFVVETVEGRKIPFDVRTGKTVALGLRGEAQPDCRVYQDVMRSYEFCYPADFNLEEQLGYQETVSGETILRSNKAGLTISTRVEEEYGEAVKESFEEFVIDRAKSMCQADGPDSSTYAGAVLGKRAFKNSHGLQVLEFSLSVVRETFGEDNEASITEETTQRPFYVISVSQPTDRLRQALFIQFEPGEKDLMAKKRLVEGIVDTVRILR